MKYTTKNTYVKKSEKHSVIFLFNYRKPVSQGKVRSHRA
jgi:hypothetical protein